GLWAPRCLVCAEPACGPADLCAPCAAALPWMPPACLGCAMPLAAPPPVPAAPTPPDPGERLCSACRHAPPPLREAHAAPLHRFPLDRLLPRLKFHRDLAAGRLRSEEHTSELQSRENLVCRLLLEKKNIASNRI